MGEFGDAKLCSFYNCYYCQGGLANAKVPAWQ